MASITPCYLARYNHKMTLRNLTIRSTILQQIRYNRSGKAKDSSKSRPSAHLLLGSEAPSALDQSITGRQLEQSHLNGRNSTPQIRLYTSLLREGYKGGKTNQYWSLIGAVLVRNMYQYWSELRPILVSSVTSTGCLPLLNRKDYLASRDCATLSVPLQEECPTQAP